jgi:hypothetical protein
MVHLFLEPHEAMQEVLLIFFTVCHFLAMSSVCTNAIMYGFLNENFKKSLNSMRLWFGRKQDNEVESPCEMTALTSCKSSRTSSRTSRISRTSRTNRKVQPDVDAQPVGSSPYTQRFFSRRNAV